jgi:hypothetical protein
MALCNIVGDFCYLGFAFDSDAAVSLPKLAGALFTMFAHTILLAFGDDQARSIAGEKGALSVAVLQLRAGAQRLLSRLPDIAAKWARVKPLGVSFSLLTLNGAGLLLDAAAHGTGNMWAQGSQIALGALIVAGCACFAAADFVRGQRAADILTKVAPSALTLASAASWVLAAATLNPFLIVSVVAFALSNLAGFFTRIDKGGAPHA